MLKTLFSVFMLTAFLAVSGSAQADIVWGSSVQIEDTGAFVEQTGTLVLALNADTAGDDSTIGGVNFAGTDLATFNAGVVGVGGVTLSSNAVNGNFAATFTQGSTAPGITDTNINNLIGSGLWSTQTVSMSGLTIGDTYILQILGNDSRNGRNDSFQTVLGDGTNGALGSFTGGTAGLNNLSFTPAVGGVNPALAGGGITGTFVADATTQTFELAGTTDGTSLNSAGRTQINGIQLRTIAATAVPEPSSIAVGVFALTGLFMRRRKA